MSSPMSLLAEIAPPLPKEELDRATQSMLRYLEQQHRLKLGSAAGAQMASAHVPEDQDQIAA